MAKKNKTQDPYKMEMLDLLNEVGGQMVIKYHTITLRPTKDKLENIPRRQKRQGQHPALPSRLQRARP